jgi:DNA modification methylase
MSVRLLTGDCRALLPTLPPGSVHCVVTSPPYWGLRDYGVAGQLGLEATPEEYVARMVEVFREVRRVLRADGTLWCNMGDAFSDKQLVGMPWRLAFALQADGWFLRADIIWAKPNPMPESVTDRPTKAHEYVFLLTKSARYFWDAEAVREPATYAGKVATLGEKSLSRGQANGAGVKASGNGLASSVIVANGRNLRSVWTIPSEPYPEAHFATFPPELARRCILAGTSAKGCCRACGAPWERVVERGEPRPVRGTYLGPIGDEAKLTGRAGFHNARSSMVRTTEGWSFLKRDTMTVGWNATCGHDSAPVPCTVLDPFAGSGTVGEVAEQNGRHSILIELSPAYVRLAEARTAQYGLFTWPGSAGADA